MTRFNETIEWSYIKRVLWWCSSIILFIITVVELTTACKIIYCDKIETELSTIQSTSPQSRCRSKSDSSRSKNESNNTENTSKVLFILPILTHLFYFLLGLNSLFEEYHIYTNCTLGTISSSLFYGIAKCFMYLVLIYRIYMVYSDSYFNYNIKLIMLLSVTVVIWTLVVTTITSLSTKGKRIYINHDYWFCIGLVHFGLLAIAVLFDLIISLICLFLFIRPLLLLQNAQDTKSGNKQRMSLHSLISKYVILSIVAILSTLCILVFAGIYDITGIIAADICINSLCIMHFNKAYNKSYNILCCCPIYIISAMIKMKEISKSKPEHSDVSQASDKSDTDTNQFDL